MRALTVRPGKPESLTIEDVAEPSAGEGSVLVEAVAVGLCGTDFEIIEKGYGEPPPGEEALILGHENLGRVVQAPPHSGLAAGDLVVAFVRRPDPVPCPACRAGEWDMCRNGRFAEHGIKGLPGFARQRWRADPDALVRLDPALGDNGVLLEPTTIVAKAWEQVERIGSRAFWQPSVAAVTGAGPVGLLAALLATQRGFQVHVFDRVTEGAKPDLVTSLGATYHAEPLPDSGVLADVIIECTGASPVIIAALAHNAPDSILCLTGVSDPGTSMAVDVGGLSRDAVLRNRLVFGTVNANSRHYHQAVRALAATDPEWLGRLVTRRVPLERYREAFTRTPNDVKVVLEVAH